MNITIITITYNAAAYLEATLQSVVAQECPHIEHLVWDGGSCDGTLDIIRRYPHVTLYQGTDQGIADAMNQGALRAKGRFLLYLHADDLLASPKTLSYLQTALLQYPHTEWFYGQAHMIDAQGVISRTTPLEPFSAGRLRKYNFITHPAALISKKLFNLVGGFDPQLRYCMDYDLWLRATRQVTPIMLPAVLASFREHVQSTSTKNRQQVTDEAYDVRNRYTQTLWERWLSYRTWRRRRACL